MKSTFEMNVAKNDNQLAKVGQKRDPESGAVSNELEDSPLMFKVTSQPSPTVRRFSNFNPAEDAQQDLKLQVETTGDFWKAFYDEHPYDREEEDEKDAVSPSEISLHFSESRDQDSWSQDSSRQEVAPCDMKNGALNQIDFEMCNRFSTYNSVT